MSTINTIRKRKMKAVVLAAGVGSRLNEVTKYIPKTMIKVNGRYIFEMIVDAITRVGITEIVFIVGYRRKKLIPLINQVCGNKKLKITFVINSRYKETNTMYSLWLARKYLNCPFVYLHGDLLFGNKMLEEFLSFDDGNAVLVDKVFPTDWDDAMKVICHNEEMKYMSKEITMNELDGTAVGIYKFNDHGARELLNISNRLIKKGVTKSWISEAINILAKSVEIKIVNNNSHPWVDIDNLTNLNMARNILMRLSR